MSRPSGLVPLDMLESNMDKIEEPRTLEEVESRLRKGVEDNPDMLSLAAYAHFLADTGREEHAKELYREALLRAPQGPEGGDGGRDDGMRRALVMGWYASLLESSGDAEDSKVASRMYDEAVSLNSRCPLSVGNRAMHLHRSRANVEVTEAAYERALEMHSAHASIICKYGSFQKHQKRDRKRAESLFRSAIKVNPHHEESLGNLAVLLHDERRNIDEAERMYERALRSNLHNVNTLSNFGLFLAEIRKNLVKAEEVYKRAMEIDAHHANSIYNYAVLLDSGLQNFEEAEKMYRRCLQESPNHGYALYNLAVLLEEHASGDERKEAKELFERAIQVNPTDSLALADYGRYLASTEQNFSKAVVFLREAMKWDSECVSALYNLGQILHSQFGKTEEAIGLLEKAIKIKPMHTGAHHFLALILLEKVGSGVISQRNKRKIESHFLAALKQSPSNDKLRLDYEKFSLLGLQGHNASSILSNLDK